MKDTDLVKSCRVSPEKLYGTVHLLRVYCILYRHLFNYSFPPPVFYWFKSEELTPENFWTAAWKARVSPYQLAVSMDIPLASPPQEWPTPLIR